MVRSLPTREFYGAARFAVERAVKSHENPRERRSTERAASLLTMEAFGILRRIRVLIL